MTKPKIRIFYDGSCRLCSGLIERIEHSSQKDAFEPVKIMEELPPGETFTAADRDVHVMDGSGRMLKGADAVLFVLSAYPALKWFVRICQLPGIFALTRIAYRIVADNRKRWFGVR